MLQFVSTTYTKDWSFNARDVQRMKSVWMEVCELQANHTIKYLSFKSYDERGLYHWIYWNPELNGTASDMLYDLAMYCIHHNINIAVSCTYVEVTQM